VFRRIKRIHSRVFEIPGNPRVRGKESGSERKEGAVVFRQQVTSSVLYYISNCNVVVSLHIVESFLFSYITIWCQKSLFFSLSRSRCLTHKSSRSLFLLLPPPRICIKLKMFKKKYKNAKKENFKKIKDIEGNSSACPSHPKTP
jgi:hypothetical protein